VLAIRLALFFSLISDMWEKGSIRSMKSQARDRLRPPLGRGCVFAALWLCCCAAAFPAVFKSMAAGFVREVNADGKTERAEGSIYYISGTVGRIILKVVNPVDQWMIFEDKTLLIYYPESNRAFRIDSKNPFILPFFQFLFDVTNEDFGLSARGFQFVRHEKQQLDLISYWAPPKELAPLIGEVVLTHRNNALMKVQTKDPKGATFSEIIYGQHISLQGVNFPMQIKITTFAKNSITQETISLRDFQINQDVPAEIRGFRVPPDATVKSVQW
jgi:outer membrane lipoprotein-sorting protein